MSKAATLAMPIALVILVGCSGGPHVVAKYRGTTGRGDPVHAQLAEQLTNSFTHVRATKDDSTGGMKVGITPTKDTLRLLESAGSEVLGPCLPDNSTYSYYLLRIYDTTGQLLAVSNSLSVPISCKGASLDFSSFKQNEIEIPFPANAPLIRDGKNLEFSVWLEPFDDRGRLTDIQHVPSSWRSVTIE